MSDLVHYWDGRYRDGRDSGAGSRGAHAAAKVDLVNRIVADNGYRTVVDWGVGDGQVASLFDVPAYVGVDVSTEAVTQAIRRCGPREGWTWHVVTPDGPAPFTGDLALSFDVLFHLTDDDSYRTYLDRLFTSAPHILIHASNYEAPRNGHMRRRRWTADIPHGWTIVARPADDLTEGFWELTR